MNEIQRLEREFTWSVGMVPLKAFHCVPIAVYCTRPLHKDIGPTIDARCSVGEV